MQEPVPSLLRPPLELPLELSLAIVERQNPAHDPATLLLCEIEIISRPADPATPAVTIHIKADTAKPKGRLILSCCKWMERSAPLRVPNRNMPRSNLVRQSWIGKGNDRQLACRRHDRQQHRNKK
jgi:hypothetical protein